MKISSAENQSLKSSTSDVVVPVVLTKSKTWMKPTDQMDSWLDTLGFYRKHIARDASSLFRCVSEVVFLTQAYHLNVRRHCIQFATHQSDVFKKLTNVPIKDYVERLSSPREWGTRLDMEVMSLLYGLEFVMYKEVKKPLEKVTSNGFKLSIILSMSYEHHYDSVYPKDHIMDAAICQSILYEILYKEVFKLEEVDYAVNKMLHDKTTHYQTDLNMTFSSPGFQMRLEMRDNCRNVKDLLNYGITPFPYKVAKSLDPSIYRNVEYDTWNEQRKGLRHLMNVWNDRELQEGSRCVINFSDRSQINRRHGYIQQMSPNKGPVVVYVEELGEKLTVPFESLELIPVSSMDADSKTENDQDLSEVLTRSLVMKDDKFSNKNTENVDNNMPTKAFSMEAKGYYPVGSIPELCNVHYVHPTTTGIPSPCYSCITSQTMQPEVDDMKSVQMTSDSNPVHERSKRHHELGPIDQSSTIPMQYTVPMYPIISPDMGVSPTVMPPNLFPSKSSNSNEYIDTNSSVRILYNRSLDSYYRFGYSTHPYYVVPSNVIYPTYPDHTIQQNLDPSTMHYSYPLAQVPSDVMYTVPVPGTTAKTELSPYPNPNTPLIHPASFNVKNSITMNTCSPAAPMPSTYPVVSSTICPVTYPAYTSPPVYYPPYDYCISCPDLQSCENIMPSYPAQSYIPYAYSEEAYPSNSQIYSQPMLPVSHS